MNTEGSKPPAAPVPAPAVREKGMGSGEGACSSLEALIRKRKMVETPDGSLPPAQP